MTLHRYLRALRDVRDVGVELRWRLGRSEHRSLAEPGCGLSADVRSRLTVGWPTAYNWAPAQRWLQHLPDGFRQIAPVERVPISQEAYPKGVVLVHFRYDGTVHPVVIDYSDYCDPICQAALTGATCYFKMQFRQGGYGDARIMPGGYPVGSPYSYRFLERLRQSADTDAKRYAVYGRFGLRFNAELRQKAITLLTAAPDLNFTGGTRFVRNSRFLRDLGRAKIVIDLPGNGDFCFRLADALSIGLCIVGPKPRTVLPQPLVDREHLIYCRDDLSDLVALCREMLANDAERERIAANARAYFDRYLHRDQLARYYVSEFLTHAHGSVT